MRTAACILFIFVSGCAFLQSDTCQVIADNKKNSSYSRSILKNTDWTSTEQAIILDMTATESLNTYQGSAHSLLVKVFLLSDKTNFLKMAATPSGITKLLDSQYKHSSIVEETVYTLYPSDTRSVELDRPSGVKYVAFVSGFYKLAPSLVTAIEVFPVVDTTPWYSFEKENLEVKKIALDLIFGSKGLKVISRKECDIT